MPHRSWSGVKWRFGPDLKWIRRPAVNICLVLCEALALRYEDFRSDLLSSCLIEDAAVVSVTVLDVRNDPSIDAVVAEIVAAAGSCQISASHSSTVRTRSIWALEPRDWPTASTAWTTECKGHSTHTLAFLGQSAVQHLYRCPMASRTGLGQSDLQRSYLALPVAQEK